MFRRIWVDFADSSVCLSGIDLGSTVMVRTRLIREWSVVFRWIESSPRARENKHEMSFDNPYRELTQVLLAEQAKVYRLNPGEGTRQIGPVPSV